MHIEKTDIPGVLILAPRRFGDARGHFEETWHAGRLAEAGIDLHFVQDNQSLSREAGTLRGLHFQSPPHAQAKLVRCVTGALLDVAVDMRDGSPTFGQWVGADLTGENGAQLLVPAGCLHGFVTRLPDTIVAYKCTDVYAPECEGAVRWDDPDLAIDWGVDAPILSNKDAAAGRFADLVTPFRWEGRA